MRPTKLRCSIWAWPVTPTRISYLKALVGDHGPWEGGGLHQPMLPLQLCTQQRGQATNTSQQQRKTALLEGKNTTRICWGAAMWTKRSHSPQNPGFLERCMRKKMGERWIPLADRQHQKRNANP